MSIFSYEFVGVAAAILAVQKLGPELEKAAGEAVQETAEWAKGAVRSGAPVDKGNYVGSIDSWVRRRPDAYEGRVGTDAPQGRRLEFDFKGPDSLGRYFNHTTLPRPHFGPVADQIHGQLVANLRSKR